MKLFKSKLGMEFTIGKLITIVLLIVFLVFIIIFMTDLRYKILELIRGLF